jgi:antitoxin (DNA-binding transcriptional repressor) of toxin-antitoxin stability system
MKAVGIKQLKAHLSDYVRLAKAGETVLVTEREEVVAELRPARRQPLRASSVDDVLDALAESGEIERASESKRGWRWRPKGLGLSAEATARIMDALREDR